MKIYTLREYSTNGKFDYSKYCEAQVKANEAKIDRVFVKRENVVLLSKYLIDNIPDITFGICHGTRRGKEQEYFSDELKCTVIGTEISSTAKNFPNTIEWDFHNVKPEWVNNVDFIFSNSWDHSYDPKKCLNAWMSCLKPRGLCILEHSRYHSADQTSNSDPFGIDLLVFPYIIALWGKGQYFLREIINIDDIHFLILQRTDILL